METARSHSGSRNEVLAACLDELGWNPKTLARKLNSTFGAGTAAESAPYHWRDANRTPRAPIPTLVSHVLSQALGREVSAADLWPSVGGEGGLFASAAIGLAGPWSRNGLVAVIENWLLSGLTDRRQFLALSGTALLSLVSEFLDNYPAPQGMTAPVGRSGEPVVDQVEHNLPLLQQLDDDHGGARHLSYVGAQFRSVGLVVQEQHFSEAARTRLIRALAEVGQLAGWMAFDAGHHGLAQRYFSTALRAAHDVDDRLLGAHILGDMSFQAASRGDTATGVRLVEAARDASRQSAIVHASVMSRAAFAYAAAGDGDQAQRAHAAARESIDTHRTGDTKPRWMYFLTPNHLDCQYGYALIGLGRSTTQTGTTRKARQLVREGQRLLESGNHAIPGTQYGQRRALFEGAWLTLSYSVSGDLERACEIGSTAIARRATVDSPRSDAVLRTVASELRKRGRNQYAHDFLPSLEHALR
jgi:hypothetical protein